MTDQATGFQVGADINPFEASMRRMIDAAQSGQAGVGGALSNLAGGPLAGLRTAFEGIAAVLAGGFLTAAIMDTAAMTDSAMDLSRALGISTNEAKAVQMALEDIGASAGEYEGAAKGMVRQLRENEEAMNKMGLETRDASGNLRPLNELMIDGVATLGDYKDGTDRALASQVLFGRGIDASSKLMLLNQDVINENQKLMQELGLTVGEQSVAAWREYDSAMDRAGFGMQGLKKAIGDTLMPVMVTMVDMFNAVAPAAITALRVALGSLTSVFLVIKQGVQQMTAVVYASLYNIVEPIRGIFEAVAKGMTGDFAGAATAFKAIGKNVSDVWKGALDKMAADSQKTSQQIAGFFTQDVKPSNDSPKAGTKSFTNPKTNKEPSQMPVYEAELAKKIELFEKAAQAEGTLRQFSKAEEAAYWKEVSTRAGLSAEDKARAEKKWRDIERTLRTDSFVVEIADIEQRKQGAQNNFEERIQLAEQAHAKTVAMYGAESKEAAASFSKILEEKRKQVQQLVLLENIASNMRRDKALADIEFDRQDAEQQLNLGLITKQQLLMQQLQFEARMNSIKLQALRESLALIDPKNDPVKKAELDAQIEQLETQHQLRMGSLRNQISAVQKGPELNLFKSMETSFSDALNAMATKAMSAKEAFSSIWRSMYASFINEYVTKKIVAEVASGVRLTALWNTLFGIKAATDAKGAAVSVATKEGETTANVGMSAIEAAANAFKAMAGIPVIGPVLAVGASLAAMSTVMGLLGNKGGGSTTTTTRIPSASGGFDIPRGLNPMTQLHEEEMVLPAHIANPLRDSLAQGSADAQGAGQGGTVVIHTTGGDFIHKRDLAKVLTAMKRDFRFA